MTNEEKEGIIAVALETEEGRLALAKTMSQAIAQAMGRPMFNRSPMFAAALKPVGKDNV